MDKNTLSYEFKGHVHLQSLLQDVLGICQKHMGYLPVSAEFLEKGETGLRGPATIYPQSRERRFLHLAPLSKCFVLKVF